MLQTPLLGKMWTCLGRDAKIRHALEGYIAICLMLADAWRRLYFKYQCCPWEAFDLAPFHKHSDDIVQTKIASLVRRARRCPDCVDLSLTVPLLELLVDPAEKEAALDLLDDVLVAARPTSIAVERNHLVNQDLHGRGLLRNGFSLQVESFIGNVKKEHMALRRLVEKDIYGAQGLKKAAASRKSRVVSSATPLRTLSGRSQNPNNVTKTILKTFSKKKKTRKARDCSGYNMYMAEEYAKRHLKATLTHRQYIAVYIWKT